MSLTKTLPPHQKRIGCCLAWSRFYGFVTKLLLLSIVFVSPPLVAAPNKQHPMMRIVQATTADLQNLPVPGSYTLVLLSPPFGQCGPCDRLWEELSNSPQLPIHVVKAEIANEDEKPGVLMEARKLIRSTMILDEREGLTYPLGVMFDPNGVVVLATFGKDRLAKKVAEVKRVLERNRDDVLNAPLPNTALVSSAGSVGSSFALPPSFHHFTLATGVGLSAGGGFLLGLSYAALGLEPKLMLDCSGAICDARARRAADHRSTFQNMNAAAWVIFGAGTALAATATLALTLGDFMPAKLTASVGSKSAQLTFETNF